MDKSIIGKNKIIAIIRGVDGLKLLRLAEALYDGGVRIIEVAFEGDDMQTFRNIEQLNALASGRVTVGAGTVMNERQVEVAARAGAQFIMSPHLSEEVVQATKKAGLISVAGAVTPSEVVAAMAYGADFIKVFPAASYGTGYVRAMKAPFPDVDFIAAAGITADTVADYIKAGYSAVGVSSSFCNKELIDKGYFDEITAIAKKFVENANA